MKKVDENRPTIKKDLDELESHIIIAVGKAIEETKTELKTEFKTDMNQMEGRLSRKIDNLSSDVSGLRNRVIDLEIKHGTPHGHTTA
ncbi:hypothetical protein HYV22_04410 [Candidatus Gottesmanbacteria bacterium]|nr:hypothetical protein [Candidatus Gottesmanbacteria bacterium]